MADIFSTGIHAASPFSQPTPAPVERESDSAAEILKQQNRIQAEKESKDSDTAADKAAEPSKEQGLDRVVAVSEDGDTLQVSPEGEEELAEASSGKVTSLDRDTPRTTEQKPRVEENFDTKAASDRQTAETGTNPAKDAAKDTETAGTAAANAPGTPEYAQKPREAAPGMPQESFTVNRRGAEESDESDERTQALRDANEKAKAAAERRVEELKANADKAADKRTDLLKSAAEDAAAKEKKDAAEKEAAEDADSLSIGQQSQAPSSYAGYTEQQLHQLYLDGTISRYDYESEVNSRKEIREEMSGKALERSREILGEEQAFERAGRIGEAIQTAYSENASNTVSANNRMDAIEKLENITLPQGQDGGKQDDEAALNVSL